MNSKDAALFVCTVGTAVITAGGCLDLKTTEQQTTGGQGGSAGNGQGGAGGEGTSSSSSSTTSSSSGETSSSSSSSSSGGMCETGDTMTCYPGPPETQSKGTCKAGEMNCIGGMWGACVGPVLPTLEQCDSPTDTNCDGRIGCKGIPDTISAVGTDQDDAVLAIATGNGANGYDGAVYGAGYRGAAVALDGTPDSAQVLFVKRDPTGVLTDWSDRFKIDPSGHAYARGIALNPISEDVIVVGTYQNASLNVGDQGLKFPGSSTVGFWAVFTSTGTFKFAKALGSGGITEIKTVGIDSAGNIYLGGRFSDTLDFGGGASVVANDGFDGFVASYAADGAFQWQQTWSGPGDQSVDNLSVDTFGGIYTAASFTSSANVGGGFVHMGEGGTDVLLTSLDPANGAPKWYNHIGSSGDVIATDIASRGGNIALLVLFQGPLGIGPHYYENTETSLFWDTVVATVDSSTGAIFATYPFMASGSQMGLGIAIDSFADVIVSGHFTSKLPLGGVLPDLTSGISDLDAFVVKLDKGLTTPRWAHDYGNSLVQSFADVAVGQATGHIMLGGGYQGILLGFGVMAPQNTNGGLDAFIGKMSN
jgi:hypothetical protein